MPQPVILDVKDLAAKTAAEIRRRPWIQGDLVDVKPEDWEWHEFAPECGVCLVGGIAAAYYGDPLKLPHHDDLYRAMWTAPQVIKELVDLLALQIAAADECSDCGRGSCDGVVDAVTSWNDAKGRTKDEVLALLDSIASS